MKHIRQYMRFGGLIKNNFMQNRIDINNTFCCEWEKCIVIKSRKNETQIIEQLRVRVQKISSTKAVNCLL